MIIDVEGDAACAEAIGLVSRWRRERGRDPILDDGGEELSMEADDDVAQFAASSHQIGSGRWVGRADFGEAKQIYRDTGIGREAAVEAVADRRISESSPARC